MHTPPSISLDFPHGNKLLFWQLRCRGKPRPGGSAKLALWRSIFLVWSSGVLPPAHPRPSPPSALPPAEGRCEQELVYTVAPNMASVSVKISFWLESSPKNFTLSPSTGWTTGTSMSLGKVLVTNSNRLVLASSMASALRKSLARCLPRQVRTPPPKGR